MKRKISIFMVVVMVVSLMTFAACSTNNDDNNRAVNNGQSDSRFIHDITPTANSTGVERWEYMFVSYSSGGTARQSFENGIHWIMGSQEYRLEAFNELGAEGWEIISREGTSYVLKRRLP